MSSLGDALGYVVFGNPISQTLISVASAVVHGQKKPSPAAPALAPQPVVEQALCEIAGHNYLFIRLAGLSGASAVLMGAYKNYFLSRIANPKDQVDARAIYQTANNFHFLHSFALMALPLARKPVLSGTMMAAGTLLFCCPMYYRALTGDKSYVYISTCGGFCLIAAWLTLIF